LLASPEKKQDINRTHSLFVPTRIVFVPINRNHIIKKSNEVLLPLFDRLLQILSQILIVKNSIQMKHLIMM